ncbi:hypothetical protein ACOBQJ_03265 [Pelotomaculum propionicicum]
MSFKIPIQNRQKGIKNTLCLLFLLTIVFTFFPFQSEAAVIEASYTVNAFMDNGDTYEVIIPAGQRLKQITFPVNSRFNSYTPRPLSLSVDNGAWSYSNYGQAETVSIPAGYGYTNFKVYHRIYSYEVDVDFTYTFELITAQESSLQTAVTAANTAASRALNNYNILNNSTKGLYKTYDIANTAATRALQAADNTSYSGNTAAYLAYLASQESSYIADTLIPNINTNISNLETIVNNISNDSTAPMITSLSGLNGATCTTSGTFYVVVSASDNSTGILQAQAKVDNGSYGSWVNLPNAILVTLTSGAHTITVNVKDEAGNSTTQTMTAFGL